MVLVIVRCALFFTKNKIYWLNRMETQFTISSQSPFYNALTNCMKAETEIQQLRRLMESSTHKTEYCTLMIERLQELREQIEKVKEQLDVAFKRVEAGVFLCK